jgi:hypothetical protein
MQRGLRERREALMRSAGPQIQGPAINTRPRGNQEPDRGDWQRGLDKLWAVLG